MRILVTGARGTLGSEVIARLLERGHAVVGLVRSGDVVVRNDGTPLASSAYASAHPPSGTLATVHGDVEREHFGLKDEQHAALQRETQLIVHSAALTSFGRPVSRYRAINVEGTQRVLDFARDRIPLVHVSTIYVCGERPGVFRESDFARQQSFGSPYEESKYQAESLVRGAMSKGLPAVIARPSIIVGHSRTGVMRKFDTIYAVYRITSAGLVRTIPGEYGATVDIVPVDWVADGVVAAVEGFDRARGRTLHLCSDRALTLREINDVCAEFPSFNVPRFVPGHVFQAVPMKGLEKRFYDEVISLYDSYFRRQVSFERNETSRDLFAHPPACDSRGLLRTIFRHAVDVGYFKRRHDQA